MYIYIPPCIDLYARLTSRFLTITVYRIDRAMVSRCNEETRVEGKEAIKTKGKKKDE